jgi:hypothetical protein
VESAQPTSIRTDSAKPPFQLFRIRVDTHAVSAMKHRTSLSKRQESLTRMSQAMLLRRHRPGTSLPAVEWCGEKKNAFRLGTFARGKQRLGPVSPT